MALVVNSLSANAGDLRDMGSIPESGRSPGGGHDNSPQCSCLEILMDREAWQATVHRVTKSWTRLKQLSMHACTLTINLTLIIMTQKLSGVKWFRGLLK